MSFRQVMMVRRGQVWPAADRRDCEPFRKQQCMQSSAARILLQLTGGLAVVVMTFFATTAVLFHWTGLAEAGASTIHVVEATYGKNCAQFQPPPGHTNQVKDGNATAAVASACNGAMTNCRYMVDSAKLHDPADGCGKDFLVSWRCGTQPQVHQFYLPAEADPSTAFLACGPY